MVQNTFFYESESFLEGDGLQRSRLEWGMGRRGGVPSDGASGLEAYVGTGVVALLVCCQGSSEGLFPTGGNLGVSHAADSTKCLPPSC